MSIDIASHAAELPAKTILLKEVSVDPDGVYAFDFDGVLSTSDEDDIYHLESWEDEEALLDRAARTLNINCGGMELKYRRHLLFQASAYVIGMPIQAGTALPLAREVANAGRLFVITARSGWQAVERMRHFLISHAIVPVEAFNLGRVRKDRQIDLLCREFPNRQIFYVEDNVAHLAAVDVLDHRNLSLIWAPRAAERRPEAELREMVRDVIGQAITRSEAA